MVFLTLPYKLYLLHIIHILLLLGLLKLRPSLTKVVTQSRLFLYSPITIAIYSLLPNLVKALINTSLALIIKLQIKPFISSLTYYIQLFSD
jgi:hypothetical protein